MRCGMSEDRATPNAHSPSAAFSDGLIKLLVFRLGAERFGVPLGAADEVVEAPAIQPLPDAPPGHLGLASLRGELVMVYDARQLLHLETGASAANEGAPLLVFRLGGRRLALAVDDVEDTITIDEREIYAAPGADASDRTVLGLVRRGSDLIAMLDVDAVLDLTKAGSGETAGERT